MSEYKNLYLTLPVGLIQAIKIRAIQENKTLAGFFKDVMGDYVAQAPVKQQEKINNVKASKK